MTFCISACASNNNISAYIIVITHTCADANTVITFEILEMYVGFCIF